MKTTKRKYETITKITKVKPRLKIIPVLNLALHHEEFIENFYSVV